MRTCSVKRPCIDRIYNCLLYTSTDAGRVCTRALHDAKPTKHTQPFPEGKGYGVSARRPR